MSAVVVTDEELEAQRRARLASHIITPTERDDINDEAARVAQARWLNQQAQQANYDKHKGAR